MKGFQMIMQILFMPMFFLSGALFPLRNLSGWLLFLTKLDPVTYGVAPLRQAVLGLIFVTWAAIMFSRQD
jgi:ABC-2 type transport system permease protein